MNKHARVSIIVPVYNEADQIGACLTAIARQTVKPFEVIVVDNNSSDDSAQIAQHFPFVTLLKQPRQGVVFARDSGFSAASGDIIGRIDADSQISSDWVATVQTIFDNPSISAVSGQITYRDVCFAEFASRVDLFWRRRMARLLGREVALQGANMAIRTDVWRNTASHVCHESGLHEDFDLAIHANWLGYQVRFDERLHASISYRQAASTLPAFSQYILMAPRTYAKHGLTSYRHMYEVVAFVFVFYPVIKFIYKGYNPKSGRFSWSKIAGVGLPARVNPATFID